MTEAPQMPQTPTLEDFQHWTMVMGRAQQMMMDYVLTTYTPEKAQAVMAEWMSPGKWEQAMAMFTPPAKMGVDTSAFTKAAEQMQAQMKSGEMPDMPSAADPAEWMNNAAGFWADSVKMWQQMATGMGLGTALAGAESASRRV